TLDFHTHDIGSEHIHGLAQHTGLRFDTAYAPANDANAVNHCGVTVGANQRIGIIDVVPVTVDATCQMFQIDLMDNTETRRHDAECIEGLHAPFHELVAFAIGLELNLHVEVERVWGAVVVDHDRVIDDQIHGYQRFDTFGVFVLTCGH